MRNTLRYIIASLAFSIGALSSGPDAVAQSLPAGTYEETNHIAYRKAVHLKEGSTNQYVIDLETFVTGEVEVTNVSIPADIVLVLDVSGSMNDNITSYAYNARPSQSYSYNGFGNNEYYYLHTDGKYYRVSRGSYDTGGIIGIGQTHHYYLTFTANGTTYYLYQNSVTTNRPSDPSGYTWSNAANETIWTGVLYTRTQVSSESKLATLKRAVLNFIDIIDQNDLDNAPEGQNRLGNRIAIVTFSSNANTLLNGLTPLSSKQSLINAVNGLTANGGTNAHLGMSNALTLLTPANGPDGKLRQLKTTVMFTDGNPGLYGDWTGSNRQGTWDSANNTISYASQIKGLAVESEDETAVVYSKVYTVGVFDDPSDYTKVYMGKTSSNYKKDATSMGSYNNWNSSNIWSNGNGTALPAADQIYSFMATDAESLNSIFESIGHASGGSGNAQVSGGSAVTVDIVSSSFSVPTGASGDAVTILVAPCTGKTTIGGKEYLTFGAEVDPADVFEDPITYTIDPATNKVSTTGFDFGTNWCGYDQEHDRYHGYKQIIRFTITIKEDAVGGPEVNTNDAESGIYLAGSDEPLIKFNRPNVKIPVNIWIKKEGLDGNDSAIFTIRRYCYYQRNADGTYILDDDDNPIPVDVQDFASIPKSEWETFTKLAVNKKYNAVADDPTACIIMLSGLDPDYVYRIEEDAWAHLGYDFDPTAEAQYTIEWDGKEHISLANPFTFTNTPKNAVVYDEDVIRNVFTTTLSSGSGE